MGGVHIVSLKELSGGRGLLAAATDDVDSVYVL